MTRQTIFVAAYVKSGSTWLTRLLGDVLDSPTGGCMPSQDAKEIATEGQDRPGSYIIRKGHFVLIDDDTGPVVPRPHRLAWKQLTDEKIIFLVRDPRDICISGAYHWRQKPEVFLERMIKGDVARCGRWDKHVYDWLGQSQISFRLGMVKYEGLVEDTFIEIGQILLCIDKDFIGNNNNIEVLQEAISRQSFATRKAQIGNDEKELRRHNMRKGVIGDWKNHFTPEMSAKIWTEFGWMMERLGYEPN